MFRLHTLFAAAILLAGTAAAQRFTSPPANASVTIAGKKITVDYYAPSLHGRKMLGNFVPYGRVWCPGANVATGLTTPVDLQFGTLKLPKGTWSIWAIPGEKEWTLIVNKQSGQHHLDYDPAEDFGRMKMNVKTLASPVETLRFELNSNGGNKGMLALTWETTEVSVPFTVLP
ncbi:MAG TPA: DUF2911 domain-containing protein [Bryobacteraceae bacterium]|jgi:hypothetical protein|nr:DUF2911 domain-containing protein [Bryobacteraceae bacterium]